MIMVVLPVNNMSDDSKNDARLNVLYSPFRKREVNPQDWESKMSYWKRNIMMWCLDCNSCILSIAKLQSSFVRGSRPASCLTTVLDDMLKTNEIVLLQDLLSKDVSQTWSSWAVSCFIKAPVVWSFTKVKESLIAKPDNNINEEYVHLAVLKKNCEIFIEKYQSSSMNIISAEEIRSTLGLKDELNVKVTLHWLQLQGQAAVATINNKTIVKLSPSGEKVTPLNEADLGLYKLQQNEQVLLQMLEQLEREKQNTEQEARNYLKKGLRQVAKSCLRKKKELEKCIDKRAAALENVQILLSRVKEAKSDGEILESYKVGLSALKTTFKIAGLSEDSVGHTIDQVKEVLEVHEEIQSALSEPMAASVDEDLESELAEILSMDVEKPASDTHRQPSTLPDLPDPPTHSPTATYEIKTSRVAQSSLN